MEIKDNNVYVRDVFLIVYQNQFEDRFTYKASLSEVFTFATGEQKRSLFTDSEISSAIYDFQPPTLKDFGEESFGGKLPDSNHLFKEYDSNRFVRASYFLGVARNIHILPMKIVSYCTALECLFTVGKSEINHKIAERVAIMLGTSKKSKKDLFRLIKDAYNYRSSLVHGQNLKGKENALVDISRGLGGVLRELIVAIHEIFSKSDQEIENFFIDLLFSENIV